MILELINLINIFSYKILYYSAIITDIKFYLFLNFKEFKNATIRYIALKANECFLIEEMIIAFFIVAGLVSLKLFHSFIIS
jgi:hypothetical protein